MSRDLAPNAACLCGCFAWLVTQFDRPKQQTMLQSEPDCCLVWVKESSKIVNAAAVRRAVDDFGGSKSDFDERMPAWSKQAEVPSGWSSPSVELIQAGTRESHADSIYNSGE